ncbi:trypsin-like peptidase domain-containing protein [Ideonella sp. BN130291]|uniref:trypsin-like peptidase domain-containing protein n=1 Tax=Ideonella sp. BN130291 TaxID=3112940 RepID=UPI002E2632AB|nr:hypothetical protein [Ideonella sp. BN130291]
MRAERVVELTFREGAKVLSQGSGYLLTPRHVLTARHVLAPRALGARCSVQPLVDPATAHLPDAQQLRPQPMPASVCWLHDDTLDVALVALDQEVAVAPEPPLLGLVAVDDLYAHPCECVGFPAAAVDASRLLKGNASYVPTHKRFDIDVFGTVNAAQWEEWAGFSGSLVFSRGHAIGVVHTVDGRWQGKLTATPLRRLVDEPAFQAFWRAEGLPELRPRPLSGAEESPLEFIVGQLHLLDRKDPVNAVLATLRKLPPRTPSRVFVVPGLTKDLHHRFIQRLAETPEMQRLLERETSAPEVIQTLPWPETTVVDDPAAALCELLAPLYRAARLPPPGADAPPEAALLRQRLDDGVMPRACWALVERPRAFGGHAELLRRLIAFWMTLDAGRPAALFLCIDCEEPPPAKPSRWRSLFAKAPQPEADLLTAIDDALERWAERMAPVDELEAIVPTHVTPWITELKQQQRLGRVRPGMLDVLDLSLRNALGEGLRLADVGVRIGPLLHDATTAGGPHARAADN